MVSGATMTKPGTVAPKASPLHSNREDGRYDPKQRGWARTLRIDDAKLENGVINWNSLKRPLHQVSRGAGHGGRIEAVLIALKAGFAAMEKYARSRVAENRHPKRKPYDNTSNNSVHFSKNVAEAGGAKTPWMLDPRPNSYIGEFQSSYPFIRYDPKSHKLSINGIGDF